MMKKEGDEQSADPAVPVEEGMDGLELDVDQTRLDQSSIGSRLVHEAFEGGHASLDLLRRRGHELRVAWAGTPYPVLTCPELTRLLVRCV